MTKKARFIERLDTLSGDEKKEITDFFTKHPNYESLIDWNNGFLRYQDFEQVFSLAEQSSGNSRRKTKDDPRLLFEKYNCGIVRQTGDFLVYYIKKHPVFGRKAVIQYNAEDGGCALWLQNGVRYR